MNQVRGDNSNSPVRRQNLVDPQAYLKGTTRHAYLNAKYNTQDRKRNEDLAVNELVGKYLNNLARVEIQQRAAKRINRIKQHEERSSSNNAVRKLTKYKNKTAKLEVFPKA